MKKIIIRLLITSLWVFGVISLLYLPDRHFLSEKEDTLNIFTWGDILDNSVVAAFERETGIKVHLNYYSSNEELLVKMRATKGKGYDLIIPSDYAVDQLRRDHLLKRVDKSRLRFWERINPNLCNLYFDPGNQYSIPFEWEIYGLGIDTSHFKVPAKPSWNLVFDTEKIDYPIAMVNDPIMAFLMASTYVNGKKTHLNNQEVERVSNLLKEQRKHVAAYVDFRADYFLYTENAPIAVSMSSYIWRSMKKYPNIDFFTPKEGTFITIENLAIPSASRREKAAYRFINYLYRPDSIKTHWDTFRFFPAVNQGVDHLHLDPKSKAYIYGDKAKFRKYQLVSFPITRERMRKLWISFKL